MEYITELTNSLAIDTGESGKMWSYAGHTDLQALQ